MDLRSAALHACAQPRWPGRWRQHALRSASSLSSWPALLVEGGLVVEVGVVVRGESSSHHVIWLWTCVF
jgi:hypothetical protein